MLLKIHPDNPDQRKIAQVVEELRSGKVIVYPTDSVYALACDINSKNAVEKICSIRDIKIQKAHFSIVCKDLGQLSYFTKQVSNEVFRLLKRALPGPYTFILKASNNAPGLFRKNKKTIGVRIPDNNIAIAIVEELGNPIVTASIKNDDEILEYITDPGLIHDELSNEVSVVIDGGIGNNQATTVIDCSEGNIDVIREGIGPLSVI